MSHKQQLSLQDRQISHYAPKRRIAKTLIVAGIALLLLILPTMLFVTTFIGVSFGQAFFISLLASSGLVFILFLPINCIIASRSKKSYIPMSIFWVIGVICGIATLVIIDIQMAFFDNMTEIWETITIIWEATGGATGFFLGISTITFFIQSIVFVSKKSPIDKQAKQACNKVLVLEGRNAQKRFAKQLKKYSLKRKYQEFSDLLEQTDIRYINANLPYNTITEAKEMLNKMVINSAILDGKNTAIALKHQLKKLWGIRNHQEILTLKAQYDIRMEQRKAEILANTAQVSYQQEFNGESKFDGNTLQKFGIGIACFFINLFTLNIARPFTTCWKQSWLTKHSVIDGKRLSFDGNGMQLFGKWVLWLLLCVVTLGIYGFVVNLRLKKWVAQHTHVAGEYSQLGGTFDGTVLQSFWIVITSILLNIITLFIATPYTVCRKLRWQARHTVNDGRRMTFDGNGMQLFGKWILWLLLSVVTFGIYTIFLSVKLKKWTTSHTHFTEQQEFVM